ncbi:MAG: hypothetical protein WB992_02210, partial [Bryobacteraceae bacterium]
ISSSRKTQPRVRRYNEGGMLAARTAIFLFIGGMSFGFQAPSPQPAQVQPGLETPWDVRKILADLERDTQQLQPLLASMDPQQWFKLKDAPSTYILQWQTAQRQLNDVEITTHLLSQKTDSLPLALDAYFRLEALEVTTRSLDEGARKYADRASADKLGALIAHNFNSRERLRDYLRDLAASTVQNYKIADEEAQRCRGIISKEPASSSTKRSKKY